MSDPPADTPAPGLFEALRTATADGAEYWSARALAAVLGYQATYRNFRAAIDRAQLACAQSGQVVADHFVEVRTMVEIGSGARRAVADFHLSRYACYLIVQNADPTKPAVALGQTYFAVKTREAETADALTSLTAAQRRLYLRGQVTHHNRGLAATAQGAGVITAQDFALFQDHGYMGLYAGERARDIHRRKGLRPSQHILDHMGAEELAANLFRATQAEALIRREETSGTEAANQAHYAVGQEVRATIARLGGTPPEDLPTPPESIDQLQSQERRRLAAQAAQAEQEAAGQQGLFPADEA